MFPPKQAVDIDETDTEFLLRIHPSQKDRAKTVPDYRWDPDRRAWVYPKTARVFDALIAEFGDDILGRLKIIRPGKASVDGQSELPLKEELEKIKKTLEQISHRETNHRTSESGRLRVALATKEQEAAELRQRTAELDRQFKEQQAANTALSSQLQEAQSSVRTLKEEVARKHGQAIDPDALFERLARESAKDATGRDAKFCSLVDRLRLNESLPLELVKALGHELRRTLNSDERGATLHDLLTEARDSGALSERGIDLGHLIRKQRNVMAHETLDKRTQRAQVLLCLFAAALLWPEFSE